MKKKFVLLSLLACIFLVGCTPIQEMTLLEIIDVGTNRTVEVYNKYRKGYKYNLPKGLDVVDNSEYNEVIESRDYVYYLYVDAVSYYNKVIEKYEENSKAYVSMQINYQDKYGYLEINQLDEEKYFIEIMYNYAKIEVIVYEHDIKKSVTYAMSVLASVSYNDNVIKSYLANSVLDSVEESFDIFEIVGSDNYLEFTQDVDFDEEVRDPDYIN